MSKINEILHDALSGNNLEYRNAGGFIRWGKVERDLEGEYAKLKEELKRERECFAIYDKFIEDFIHEIEYGRERAIQAKRDVKFYRETQAQRKVNL